MARTTQPSKHRRDAGAVDPAARRKDVLAWCAVIEEMLDTLAVRGHEDDDRPRVALSTLRRCFEAGDAPEDPERDEALEQARTAAMNSPAGSPQLDAAFATLHLARFALGVAAIHSTRAYAVGAWSRLGEPADAALARVERTYAAHAGGESTAP